MSYHRSNAADVAIVDVVQISHGPVSALHKQAMKQVDDEKMKGRCNIKKKEETKRLHLYYGL